MDSIDQKTYLAVVKQKLHTLRKLSEDLERPLPPKTALKFIEGVRYILDAIDVFLLYRINYLKTTLAADPGELAAQIAFNSKVALRILGAIHQQYFPLLHAASQRSEYLIQPSIDRAVKLFAKDCELTLVPDFEYNYAFVGIERFAAREIELLETHSDHATKVALEPIKHRAAGLPHWICFLHFPIADRDSALNLCILAHELAHLVDKTAQIYQKLMPIELDKDSFDELVAGRCSAPVGGKPKPGVPPLTIGSIFTPKAIENQCYLDCNKMLENWIRELIADVVAIHGIGPASFFAFNDFFAYMGSENRPSSSHPAPAFRLLLMLDELETLGYVSSSESLDSVLKEALVRVQADAGAITYIGEAKVVHKTIQKNLPDLLVKIRQFISMYSFKATSYQPTASRVLERLKAGVAPIEIYEKSTNVMRPISVMSVLNAGWELYKTNLAAFYDQFKNEVDEMERLQNLNHLLFKAIEAGEVVRRWK